jgi:hypothetical protein
MTQTTPMPPGLDPNFVFNQLMPLIAVVVVGALAVFGLRLLFRTPVGEAIAQRIRSGARGGHRPDPEMEHFRAEAEGRMLRLEEQVADLTERLDFSERLLIERRGRQLGAGQGSGDAS